MLFSEPKIPQCGGTAAQCNQKSEFQCSSASRKFLNRSVRQSRERRLWAVSVLFSEPKIPQSPRIGSSANSNSGFSALQRAENSSIKMIDAYTFKLGFSALQRAENSSIEVHARIFNVRVGFSALQRAENSSIYSGRAANSFLSAFQCSSASRKFLNLTLMRQQNSEIIVSVLFSEPKIPQCGLRRAFDPGADMFQCSSASRKFLNQAARLIGLKHRSVSVLFSEPKIPQLVFGDDVPTRTEKFQCSSASRKFLNLRSCWRC